MDQPEQRDRMELAETRRTLPIALLRAREAVMERFRPMLSAHDVTEQQWRVMRVLQETGGSDASQLAQAACVLPPSLTRMLRSLESRGFIALSKDPDDGRRALIALTAAGQAFLQQVSPESAAIYAEIEGRIGRERIAHLLDEIEALLAALSED
ncbi:homoprotocatechuate degradation operon regulator HpaR [Phaeovulum sp. W22_SRMD_FR3]|uniref:homoprotocatechuate degradation operon regulator HpaR n=1 Tax=Phaeovulum sp. W22_SRMD_FR3 TaxID=3240274 RepID=UPI003F9DEE81